MVNRASRKKSLIRTSLVIICNALFAGYVFLDADTDQRTEKKQIFESRILASEETVAQNVKEYGIYVVQPGDNIKKSNVFI